MKIDEALKLSDVAVSTLGNCVARSNQHDWYHCGGHIGVYSLHELTGKFTSDTWQPAYIRPQFKIGEKVSFLQACLSGQCFVTRKNDNVRRCVDMVSGKIEWYRKTERDWHRTALEFSLSDPAIIVADPSQEQPETEKRQRTHAEIVADIKTLVSELEGARSE